MCDEGLVKIDQRMSRRGTDGHRPFADVDAKVSLFLGCTKIDPFLWLGGMKVAVPMTITRGPLYSPLDRLAWFRAVPLPDAMARVGSDRCSFHKGP
jgi:hypothetical protein